MKPLLTLLSLTTALAADCAAIAAPMPVHPMPVLVPADATQPGPAALGATAPGQAQLWYVDSDEDDDEGDDDDECEDDDEGEGDCTGTGQGNAAPAGTVAPPANGLFGNGTAPTVKTN